MNMTTKATSRQLKHQVVTICMTAKAEYAGFNIVGMETFFVWTLYLMRTGKLI